MKKILIAFSLISIVVLNSCENSDFLSGCLEVRVVDEVCGSAILQVISGDPLGPVANSWTNNEGETFNNVFTTYLDPCGPKRPQGNETFFVKIVAAKPESDCIICQAMLANTPEEYYNVAVTLSCNVN